jgi:zeta-carotene desaturase
MMRPLLLAGLCASAAALAPPGAPRTLKTRRQAAVAEPDAKAKVSSANAKRQVGNDAFLNKDLRARARGGTGVTSKSKLKVGIVGAGLAGMVCAMDLADAGHDVEIFELRPFVGGKVSSWKDKDGNHIEMGLHVFFGCYYNLFGIMERTGSYDLLRMKEHIHTFVNKGGDLGALDFRFPVGAPVSGLQAFARTEQLGWGDKAANALRLGTSPIVRALVDFDGGMDMVRDLDDITFTEWFTSFGGSRGSIDRMWDPIAYALGFIDCDHISARCMLTIFMLFAIRTEASVLRMLDGSPQTYLHDPIVKYLEERGVKINLRTGIRDIVYETDASGKPCKVTGLQVQSELKEFDAVVAAVDLPGAKKLIPEPFRVYPEFDRIYELDAVPIATVQLRFDGWVTELQDQAKMKDTTGDLSDGRAPGIDNLLYSADAEFSCFADLALTSPAEYYKEGEGSLMQCVMDSRAYGRSEAQIVQDTLDQIHMLFPSSKQLKMTWSNVVKLGQSLYREKPGQDKYRPSQATPIPNFFLAGSYTYQDYIDSMEGATKSGLMCADEIVAAADAIAKEAATNLDLPAGKVPPNVPGRGPLDMTAAVTFVDDGSFDANENTDMSQRPASAPAIDSF